MIISKAHILTTILLTLSIAVVMGCENRKDELIRKGAENTNYELSKRYQHLLSREFPHIAPKDAEKLIEEYMSEHFNQEHIKTYLRSKKLYTANEEATRKFREDAEHNRKAYVSQTGIEDNPVFAQMANESPSGYYLQVRKNPISFVSEVGDPRLDSLEETEKLFVFHYRRMWRNNDSSDQERNQYKYDNSAGDFLAELLRQKFKVNESRIGELCDIAE